MSKRLIIFDGYCSVCSSFLIFVIKHDKSYFKILDRTNKEFDKFKLAYSINESSGETIYCLIENKLYSKSSAIIQILSKCGNIYNIISKILYLIP